MKNFLGLVIVVGLIVGGWMNRDRLAEALKKQNGQVQLGEDGKPLPPSGPVAAKEAQQVAQRLYPGLAIPNSPMNKRFLEMYNEAQDREPTLFHQEDWPIQLAERAIISLGGKPMPRPTPPPTSSGMQGTTLDKKSK